MFFVSLSLSVSQGSAAFGNNSGWSSEEDSVQHRGSWDSKQNSRECALLSEPYTLTHMQTLVEFAGEPSCILSTHNQEHFYFLFTGSLKDQD